MHRSPAELHANATQARRAAVLQGLGLAGPEAGRSEDAAGRNTPTTLEFARLAEVSDPSAGRLACRAEARVQSA